MQGGSLLLFTVLLSPPLLLLLSANHKSDQRALQPLIAPKGVSTCTPHRDLCHASSAGAVTGSSGDVARQAMHRSAGGSLLLFTVLPPPPLLLLLSANHESDQHALPPLSPLSAGVSACIPIWRDLQSKLC